MKKILASCLVNQNGYNYPAHLCDDGEVYIDWGREGFQSKTLFFRFNPPDQQYNGGTKHSIYEEAEKFLKETIGD